MNEFANISIRSTALIGFSDLVEQAGASYLELIDRAGLSRRALQDLEMMIPFRNFGMLLELAARELDMDHFGLEWARVTPPEFPNLGPIVLLQRVSNTLGDWLDQCLRYWKFHTNAFTLQLMPAANPEHCLLRYSAVPQVYPTRQLVENGLANITILGRNALGDQSVNPVAVHFRHRGPADTAAHVAMFRCPVEFNALHDELILEKEILQRPLHATIARFRGILDIFIRLRMALTHRPDHTFRSAVALAISCLIGTQQLSLDVISELMGVSVKKMQRLLADEGTNFSDILDKVRENIARQLLRDSDIAIEQISGLLDYSGPPAFILAFRRWTGDTPLAYRKREQSNADRFSSHRNADGSGGS